MKSGDSLLNNVVRNEDGLTTDFAIFNIRLMVEGEIEQHGDLFATVRAVKKVFFFHKVLA